MAQRGEGSRGLRPAGTQTAVLARNSFEPKATTGGMAVGDCPDFLDLPERDRKPRRRGLSHVLDKGTTTAALEALLAQAGDFMDVLKIGWGIAYIDPTVKERVALCNAAGVTVSLGGTLLEVCEAQGRVDELRRGGGGIGVGG